ncbi:survival of motor neuron-related-splicing factor 30-like [Xenia sp. Carnegie-2017]|uniref:survival of motor neuron-related-splicing factor 30-like n=1 Tax=Xenia sp. Carnegie-2017 TaxID=2897299 RepID=UPI001F038B1E|nr:survival of motor neuron-related-splicing factor 30-like [Xenia sp. Carnegie-2017]
MAELKELSANLMNYRAQLQQVDAALTTEPDNEELLKLKTDLEEVIALTSDLVNLNQGTGNNRNDVKKAKDTSTVSQAMSFKQTTSVWKEGDVCQAISSEDGCYYDATIDRISEDGATCTVTLEPFGNTEIIKVSSLKKPGEAGVKIAAAVDYQTKGEGKQNKELTRGEREKLRELKKKKALKKKQKRKELNEAREKEKSKWLDFFNGPKSGGKKKGITKKSIFASPETVEGKVGIGTCGIGGQPMTSFTQPDKLVYRR